MQENINNTGPLPPSPNVPGRAPLGKTTQRKSPLERLNITPEMFAERVRYYRAMNRMSLQEMSDIVGGVSWVTVWRWEHGKSVPNSKITIEKLLRERVI